MENSKSKLYELGIIIATSPKGSAKYRKAMKELDRLLEMPSEPKTEGEPYDDSRQTDD